MQEFLLKSDDNLELNCYIWNELSEKPQAIIHLVHGSSEHALRYDAFARELNENNIIVVGNDHRGHGKTGKRTQLGHFADNNGWNKIVNDEKVTNEFIQKTWPGVPIFLLGHSMGSFIVRDYAIKYSDTIAGLIIMGTAEYSWLKLEMASFISWVWQLFQKNDQPSRFIWNLSYKRFNNKFKNEKPRAEINGAEWLTKNRTEQIKMIKDELTGHVFTLRAFRDLFFGLKQIRKKSNIKKMRFNLPILIISGRDDPVGKFGRGPRKVFRKMQNLGYNVEFILYDKMRHEILNECDNEAVKADIIYFLKNYTK